MEQASTWKGNWIISQICKKTLKFEGCLSMVTAFQAFVAGILQLLYDNGNRYIRFD